MSWKPGLQRHTEDIAMNWDELNTLLADKPNVTTMEAR